MFESFVSYPAASSSTEKRTVVDARLHHWTVSFIQITDHDEHVSRILRSKNYTPSNLAPLCIVSLSLKVGMCHGVLGSETNSLAASFQSAAVHLRVTKARSSRTRDAVPVSDLEVGHSSVAVCGGTPGISIDASIGALSFQTPGWSPPLILKATQYFVAPFIPTVRRSRKLGKVLFRRRQLVFTELAQKSCAFTTHADPLSRTQVSFMVNSGVPRMLRADPTLSILAHMRSTLRRSAPSEFTDSLGIIPRDELPDGTVQSRLTAAIIEMFALGLVDLHPEQVDQSFVYQRLYPSNHAVSTFDTLPPLAVDLTVQGTQLSLGDDVNAPNLLELGLLRLRANLSSRSFLKSNPSGNKSSTSLLSVELEQAARHVVLSSTIAMVRFVVNPTLFTVIRGILRLTRGYTNQKSGHLPSPTEETMSRSSSSSPFYVVEASFAIEELEHRAVAQLLSLGIRLKEFSITSSMVLGRTITPRIGAQAMSSQAVTARFREFSLEARSIQEDRDQIASERALLASMVLVAGECFVVRSSEKVKGTFALAALKFSVPRSAMKLYSFSKQWEAEYLP